MNEATSTERACQTKRRSIGTVLPAAESTIVEDPTEAAPNERVKVSFEGARIYGLDACGLSTETREVQVTEGRWEATTFE